MPQIKITITDEEYLKLEQEANLHLNSISKEARVILHQHLYNSPGMSPTPVTTSPVLTYPDTTRSSIPETPYKITMQQSTQSTQPEKPKKRTIIGGKLPHPMLWLDENDIDPNDISETAYNKLHTYYPDIDISQFVNYQHDRQNRYVPDPNDPFDPTINNPYLRNK